MTKTKTPRNSEAQATIRLDGIRTAAREIRTLFPDAERPAINTLMNTMTRELGLGATYGSALATAQEAASSPAPKPILASYSVGITVHLTCPAWVAKLLKPYGAIHTTQDTFRGKPIYLLRFHGVPCAGSREDVNAAAQDFVAANPLLQRKDVTIRKIDAEDVSRHPMVFAHRGPDPKLAHYDPYFQQPLPAGAWDVQAVHLFEIPRSAPIEHFLKKLKKTSFFDADTCTYQAGGWLVMHDPGGAKNILLAVRIHQSHICDDPHGITAPIPPSGAQLAHHFQERIPPEVEQAFDAATPLGCHLHRMDHTPIVFRLSPVRAMNGRTVPDSERPAMLVDTGAALSDIDVKNLESRARDTDVVSRIKTLAGIIPEKERDYRVTLVPPSNSHPRRPHRLIG